ncbi:hypothetical protein GCM10022248_18570 [Nonomuraea soli]
MIAPPATAATDPLKVTFVARQCPEYSDIMANLARNNIQESLRDLGKDSVYTSGQPIDPAIEDPNDPNCSPLVGWRFTWGNGVNGQLDLLSLVSGPAGQVPPTKPSTAWLDDKGLPTGRSVAGAVTVTLDDTQRQLLAGNRLWVQGGYVDDPLLNGVFGKGAYGFGALRCSVDNLNGDNVEQVAFPSGRTHVFCYYYAVTPPPQAGTIVVRKEIVGGGSDEHTVGLHGNVSYNPGGGFQIDATPGDPGDITFNRAETLPGDDPWEFEEDPVPGWTLDSLTCVSADGTSTSDVTGAKASITLAAGDTVTCTYVNRRVFDTGITVYKRTLDGVGGPFPITVERPDSTVTDLGAVETAEEGVPVEAGEVTEAEAGDYVVTETLPPPTAHGYWTAVGMECVDVDARATRGRLIGRSTQPRFHVTLDARPVNCTITNRFHPEGSITIEKLTRDGYTTTEFVIRSLDPKTVIERRKLGPFQEETTTAPGSNPDSATRDHLRPGTYFVSELNTDGTSGDWELISIVCDGRSFPVAGATARIELTADSPDHTCRFTNELDGGTLMVEKLVRDPRGLRTGPVKITVRCDNGQTALLRAAHTGLVRMPEPLRLQGPTRCVVRETADGASGPIKVRTFVRVDGGERRAGRSAEVAVNAGEQVTVRLINTYVTKAKLK